MAALNKNNSAIKRIMQEAKELAADPSTDYTAAPLEDDIFEWHCTLRGPVGTEFEGGLYHFRIVLPAEYPFRPPSIMVLTPNGRFELNTKICISFTNYHEELWQPAWGVRTAIIGLQGFFPLKGQAAVGIGSVEYPASERKRLATLSREWTCPHCNQANLALLPDPLTSTVETNDHCVDVKETPQPDQSLMTAKAIVSTTSTSIPPTQVGISETKLATQTPTTPASVQISRDSKSPGPHLQFTPSAEISNDISKQTTTARMNFDNLGSETSTVFRSRRSRGTTNRGSQKPPVLLDTAICILLVLLFAIICRRVV